MPLATILCDNREQKPYDFSAYPVDTEDVTLRTGDYTIAGFCDHDEENDTYVPRFAIERKSGTDFISSITRGRGRFEREIRRADDWRNPLEVVVEEPWTLFMHNLGFMKNRKVHPNQVKGTVQSWTDAYNVNFHFAGDRLTGEKYTFETLMGWLRASIVE